MRIQFVGAVGRVTGSCTLLHYQRTGIKFLVDCGMVQGEHNDAVLNAEQWPFVPKDLSFVLLTHAHLDHCGLIPRLYKDGFAGKVICTRFTAQLASANLEDAVKHDGVPYQSFHVKQVRFEHIDDRENFGFSTRLPIDDDLYASFPRSAHIGGACGITVSWKNSRDEWSEISFSADVGNNTKGNCYQSLLRHRQTPFAYPRHIVLESTYGDRKRDGVFASYPGRIDKLAKIVQSSMFERSGPLVIPCFSIHRTQEMLVDLHVVLEHALPEDPDTYGRPLLRTSSNVEDVIEKGLAVRHVEGEKSLIAHWSKDAQTEWLSWFVRHDVATDGRKGPVLLPRDRSPITIGIVAEKLRMLRKQPGQVRVVVDSPLAMRMNAIYARELSRRQRKNPLEPMYRNRDLAGRLRVESEDALDGLLERLFLHERGSASHFGSYTLSVATETPASMDRVSLESTICVTGGGMCEGGPVVEHLKTVLLNENATVLLTGYAPPRSLAGKLRALPSLADELRRTEILDVGNTNLPYRDIRARIEDIGPYYSGHADHDGLVQYLFEIRSNNSSTPNPARVFLNHGDDRKRKALAEAIGTKAAESGAELREIAGIEIPRPGQGWFDLESDEWIDEEGQSAPMSDSTVLDLILAEQRTTNALLSQLIEVLAENRRTASYGALQAPQSKD